MAKPALVISLKSIAIFLKENVVAVAFIKVLKTAAKVLYRKRFDKKEGRKIMIVFDESTNYKFALS